MLYMFRVMGKFNSEDKFRYCDFMALLYIMQSSMLHNMLRKTMIDTDEDSSQVLKPNIRCPYCRAEVGDEHFSNTLILGKVQALGLFYSLFDEIDTLKSSIKRRFISRREIIEMKADQLKEAKERLDAVRNELVEHYVNYKEQYKTLTNNVVDVQKEMKVLG
eukprot:Seg3558.2 transcript_id=Seg3558.2/GoldUCD/mRNA.D3Y31 product="hypothetical protein" protein_id=Seg3558.2/GoldUCD/D3Y31